MADSTVKTIDQLPTKASILGSEYLPLDDGASTYKVTWAALLALTGGIESATVSGNTITITTKGGQTYRLTPSDSSKQDVLTFDNTPTNGSSNPVTSDGVYDAVYEVSVALAGEVSRATAAENAIPAQVANRNYYGTCDTAAATAEKAVTISDTSFSLVVGAEIFVKFTRTNTAANPTIKVNDTAAKSVWYGTAALTTSNLGMAGTAGRYEKYVYDGTYWVWAGHGIDSDTTYTNASLGQGYGTCDTAAATAAKVVTLSSYALVTGGVVAVKFTYDVPANATMNINSKGAKSIYFKGAAITAGVIKAGDIVTFIYSVQYHVLSIARMSESPLPIVNGGTGQTTVAAARNALGLGNTSGALPIANGGTGQTTVAAARNALGLGNTSGAVPVANGGTGAATVAAALDNLGNPLRSFYGTCGTAADQQVKVVTISDSNWKLITGCIIGVKFTNTNTYSATASAPVKLNVNNSGEKQIYYSNSAAPTGTNTTAFGTAATINYYMYDGTYWVWLGHSTDSNTTYTNVKLGQGYATCSTAAATAAKTATLSSYELTTGGVVAVKFTYAVPASATLNVNSKGAKAIYYKGAAITAGVINAGDIAYFMYNGFQYVLLGVDTALSNMPHYKDVTISATASTGTVGGMDYTHTQTVSWTGMTANDEVRLYITGGTYDDDIAVDSQSGQCVIYFGSEPTTLTTVRLVANAVYA